VFTLMIASHYWWFSANSTETGSWLWTHNLGYVN